MSIAAKLSPAVEREDRQARLHANAGLYTEGGLRIGRATEALLYFVARELGISLTDRQIPGLEHLRRSLTEKETKIIRVKSDETVRDLANVSKNLAEAIAMLSRDPVAREGKHSETSRRLESLFRDIVTTLEDVQLRQRLEICRPRLRSVLKLRNDAAHVAADGSERELTVTDYRNLEVEYSELTAALLAVVVAARAKKLV